MNPSLPWEMVIWDTEHALKKILQEVTVALILLESLISLRPFRKSWLNSLDGVTFLYGMMKESLILIPAKSCFMKEFWIFARQCFIAEQDSRINMGI